MEARIEARTQKNEALPNYARVIGSLAWVTFLEVIRDKILYNILLCALLLLGLGFFASKLTFIRPDRVILDFGLTAINISCSMIAIFVGASLLGREFDRRTVDVALSHPISRLEFILGKFVGMATVILVNWFLLCVAYLWILGAASPEPFFNFHTTLFFGLALILFQSFMIAGLAIFFSAFSTTSLAVIITIGLYLIGNNISQIRLVASRLKSTAAVFGLNTLSAVLPNLEFFNLGTKVTYGFPVTWRFFLTSAIYGLVVANLALLMAGIFMHLREN